MARLILRDGVYSLLFLLTLFLFSCSGSEKSPEWSIQPDTIHPDYPDVIWFSGTVVCAEGSSYTALLTEDEKVLFRRDAQYVHDNLFPDSFNLFCPYYHQFTFAALNLPREQFDSIVETVADEAYAIFHQYMLMVNNGRPYILAGMSQGAMMVRGILQRMTDDEYAQMRAAYMLGYGLSKEDLMHPHIKPAEGESDRGVVVSFNSVASHEGIWDVVYNDAAVCINPVNWRNDTATARFVHKGDTLTVQRDTLYNVLILRGETSPALMQVDEPWATDNRHLSDLFVYTEYIRKNALKRGW